MSNIKKIPYEISIWEDVLTYNITYTSNGNTEVKNVTTLPNLNDPNLIGDSYKVNYQFFDEQKLAVIGADDMETPIRAHSPIFTRNVNGSTQLVFTMYNHIYDYESGEYINNPYIGLLTNERKIKLKYEEPTVEDPWYDLIIKNIQESSDNKTYTYTASGLAINELSKNGFNIELDNELMNNQGTVVELGREVLKGSDWQLDEENCDNLKQWIEEPLYEVVLKNDLKAVNLIDLTESTIIKNTKIYVFYSYIIEEKAANIQFITDVSGANDNYVIRKPQNIYMADFNPSALNPQFYSAARAERLEYRQKSMYDEVSERVVYEYTKDGKAYYGYTESQYISPTYVRDLIVNGTDFTSTAGWGYYSQNNEVGDANISIEYDPPIGSDNWTTNSVPCLNLNIPSNVAITNSGLFSNKSYLGGIASGQEFGLMVKSTDNINNLKFYISSYDQKTEYLTFSTTTAFAAQGYSTFMGTWSGAALSVEEFVAAIPTLFIGAKTLTNVNIIDIQLFEVIRVDNQILLPGEITGEDIIIQDINYFYPAGQSLSKDSIQFSYKGPDKPVEYIPVYNANLRESSGTNFEKIRSIVGKESNRYNLIQSLCETFECWADFKVEHNLETGKIKTEVLNDAELGQYVRQKKSVAFKEAVGEKNYAGFRYGINLKNIQRTLESNQLASKVIVSSNSNELAQGGFCSISRADENPTLEDFILCFDYYIQHNLLNNEVVANDLYEGTLADNKWIGYYPKLFKLNTERDALIERNATLTVEESSVEAEYQSLQLLINENNNLSMQYQAELANNSGYTYEQFINNEVSGAAKENTENQNYVNQITQYKKIADNASSNLINISTARQKLVDEKRNIEDRLSQILAEKEKLHKLFYTKYSRYIQEGTWISEDYIDDNLYYLDAHNVARTSAFPKVSYNIDVMSLEGNPEYVGYSFKVGDISYIEDTEFFGYHYVDNIKTPYHEEVVVAERVDNLDSPESNQIRVQNYKTQFEDLFQRIEATNQAVEYSSGAINKVSNTITPEGTIKVDILQNSLLNNSFVIQNAKDQSVVWGDQGVTITNTAKPNEVIRLVSGGIMLSQDGGQSYKTGVTAAGINASYITSGQIDTSILTIRNGAFPSFRWDGNGISAYYNDDVGYNFNHFVRFDQYGLYGLSGAEDGGIDFTGTKTWAEKVERVREAAQFSVTWNGFRIQSQKKNNSYVDISSENDIRVMQNDRALVQLGCIDATNQIYGLRLNNALGEKVLESSNDGVLWLSKALQIQDQKYSIKIGVLEDNAVINANNKFVVYNDGSFSATSANITGTINAKEGSTFVGHIVANSGTIGGLNIANLQNLASIRILAESGTIFKVTDSGITPEQLTFSVLLNSLSDTGRIEWLGGEFLDSLGALSPVGVNTPKITIAKNKFQSDIYFVKARYILEDGTSYEDLVSISRIKDGAPGAPGPAGEKVGLYILEQSQAEVLKFIDTLPSDPNGAIDVSNISYSPTKITLKVKYLGSSKEEYIKFSQATAAWNVSFESEEYKSENLQDESIQTYFGDITVDPDADNTQLTTFPRLMYAEAAQSSTLILDLEKLTTDILNATLSSKSRKIATSNLGIFRVKITVKEEGQTVDTLEAIIPCKFGIKEEAAQFNILASGLEASIRSTKLDFNANGLTVENGAFTITKNGEPLLYSSDGNLVIKGDVYATKGVFNGEVNATSGSFTGAINASTITAREGTISGFVLRNNSLVAENFVKVSRTAATITPNEVYYKKTDDGYIELNFFEEVTFASGGNFNPSSRYFVYNAIDDKYVEVSATSTPQAGKVYLTIRKEFTEGQYFLLQPALTLEGGSIGKITATNIEIGENASIRSSIRLGDNAVLHNPDKNNGLVLTAGKTTIDNQGHLAIASLEGINNRWRIEEDGKAIFDELHTNYAEIGTSVLKVNTIQSAGSTMIFKEAYMVALVASDVTEGKKQLIISLNEDSETGVLNSKDFILLSCGVISNRFVVTEKTEIAPYKYTLESSDNFSANDFRSGETSLVRLGTFAPSASNAGHIFTISSDFEGAGNNSARDFFNPNGLTLSELTGTSTNPKFTKHVVLGKLDNIAPQVGGYGLYADNVFLKGSLTSETHNKNNDTITYAGINTTHGATSKIHGEGTTDDTSRIVFWAGAKGTSIDAIQNAAFQVTEAGSLYAKQGRFEGSLLTSSFIQATTIYASSVHPIAGSDEASLKIYDTYASGGVQPGGIWFMGRGTEQEEIPTLALNSQGLFSFWKSGGTIANIKFIGLDPETGNVDISANTMTSQTFKTATGITLGNRGLSAGNGVERITLEGSVTKVSSGGSTQAILNNNGVELNGAEVIISDNLILGDKVQFKKVEGGYNIFVL